MLIFDGGFSKLCIGIVLNCQYFDSLNIENKWTMQFCNQSVESDSSRQCTYLICRRRFFYENAPFAKSLKRRDDYNVNI